MCSQKNRIALVTGASSGIGEAIARKLLARQWHVVGVSRRPSAIQHESYTGLLVDLAELPNVVTRVETELGALVSDTGLERLCLINCAADPGLLGTVTAVDPTAALNAYAVNVMAPMWLSGWIVRASPPDVPVRIVNVSSGAGVTPYEGLAVYGSTKAALRMIGMVFAKELEAGPSRDVTILSYSPGAVDTAMQHTARTSAATTLPIVDMFRRFHTEGTLLSPEVPAREIARYAESDGHARFAERRIDERDA